MLQQHLPFTVLKLQIHFLRYEEIVQHVATALTVYGIETLRNLKKSFGASKLQQHLPFTVLKL